MAKRDRHNFKKIVLHEVAVVLRRFSEPHNDLYKFRGWYFMVFSQGLPKRPKCLLYCASLSAQPARFYEAFPALHCVRYLPHRRGGWASWLGALAGLARRGPKKVGVRFGAMQAELALGTEPYPPCARGAMSI